MNTGSSSNDSSVTSDETTATSQKEEEMETDKEEDSNEVTIEDVPDESNTNRQESRQDRSSAETQSQQDEYVFSCNYMLKSISVSTYYHGSVFNGVTIPLNRFVRVHDKRIPLTFLEASFVFCVFVL